MLIWTRKQKCGGFTYGIKCRPCTGRKVKCSFEEEVKDPRHNPYLRLRSSRSPPTSRERVIAEQDLRELGPLTRGSPLKSAHIERIRAPFPAGLVTGAKTPSADKGLPKEVEILKSRYILRQKNARVVPTDWVSSLIELERRLIDTQSDRANLINTPRSLAGASFRRPSEPCQFQQNYQSPHLNPISLDPFSSSDTHSLSSPQGPITTDGPLKTLNDFQVDEPVEDESHDPITRSIITDGEAYVLLRLQVFQTYRFGERGLLWQLFLELSSKCALSRCRF